MYIPKAFEMENEAEKIAFMKQYSFATMITAHNNIPLATQLPFVIGENAGKLVLSAHFSSDNEQAKYIEAHTSLVVFSEPHAYISPAHYDRRESVPTWDYIAVQAYGKAKIITDQVLLIQGLEQMIGFYDPAYLEQWQQLTDKFKQGMMRGIVAFELEVSDLQGQQKLSQNKSVAERKRMIEQLEQSRNTVEKDLAKYIQKTL